MPSAVPEIVHDDSGVHSLDSLHSENDHVQSIPSIISYADQQQFEDDSDEVRREAKLAADEIAQEAKDFINTSERDAQDFINTSERDARDFGKQASQKYEQAKSEMEKEFRQFQKEASAQGSKAKKEARKAEAWADKNKTNPVILGNGVAVTALAGLLGFGAYRMHKANTLTWNVVGAWAGAVGLFAVGDYFVSQYDPRLPF